MEQLSLTIPAEAGEMRFLVEAEDGAATITGYSGDAIDLVIPPEIGGFPVRAVGEAAFAWNRQLRSVRLPEGLTSIGGHAFFNCWGLERVDIPASVCEIGDDAFNFCRAMRSLSLPDGVRSVGREAFARCDSLKTVRIGSGLTRIGDDAFYCCQGLEGFSVSETNPAFEAAEGVLFRKSRAILVSYPNARTGEEYIVPETVRKIGRSAFAWNTGLRSVTLPERLESVGNQAFSYACLQNVTLGRCLRVIGEAAFTQCRALRDLVFPDTLKAIRDAAFCQCPSLTRVVIPDGVVHIGAHAFQLCTGVREVYIGRNIAFIGDRAFSGTNYTLPGQGMKIERFTVLNRVVPIDTYTFDFNPKTVLYGLPDNVTLKARAGTTMRFCQLPDQGELPA